MVKRIGEILQAKGYVSERQLKEALQIQAQSATPRLLGQILIDQGLISQEQAQLSNYCQKCRTLDLVARINSTNNLQELLSIIIEAASEIMEAEGSSVIVHDSKNGDLIIAVPTGPASMEISGTRIPGGKGFCGWVVSQGQPLVVTDAPSDPRFFEEVDKLSSFQTRNVICVPLRTPQGEIIGAVEAVNRKGGQDFTEADIPLFSVFGDQVAIALERNRLQKEALEKQSLEQELNLAYQIQKGFWPKEVPSYPGLDIAAMNLPAKYVGGDYYDFILLSDELFALVIADVSGKGMSAALLMASIRSMLRTQIENKRPLEETISLVNNAFAKDTPSNRFVTLIYGVIDTDKREFHFVNAGHHPPLLYESTTQDTTTLATERGLILGFQENERFKSVRQRLRPGQALVLFTDGVIDAQNPSEEQFGEDRLRTLISAHGDDTAKIIIDRIYEAVREFMEDEPQFDDLTMIVVKVEGRRQSD